jgi:SAM-dependent methyltransferase
MSHGSSPDVAALYDAFDGDPGKIVEFLRALASEHGLGSEPAVLDVGCGVGRLIPPLAGLGWKVTAMEPHPGFRAWARRVAGEHGAVVVPGGFGDVDAEEAFDLVMGINSAFAHVLTPAERLDAFRRAFRALRPGGVLLLDLPNFLWILKNYRAPEPMRATWAGRPVTLTHTHEIDVHAGTFTTDQAYTPDGADPVRMRHVYAMNVFPELEAALRAAGFGEVRTYGGWGARAPETLTGARMLIAAAKPR